MTTETKCIASYRHESQCCSHSVRYTFETMTVTYRCCRCDAEHQHRLAIDKQECEGVDRC